MTSGQRASGLAGQMFRATGLWLAASLAWGAPAQAVTYNGTGGAIPNPAAIDFNVTPGVFTSDIVIGDSGVIGDITVSIDLQHGWVGDLVVYLTHVESNVSVDLFRRVVGDDTFFNFGDNSNLDGVYRFNDAFTGDLWLAATGGGDAFVVPPGDYQPVSNTSTTPPIGDQTLSSLSPFVGANLAGTWRLTVEDWATSLNGSVNEWSLTFETARAVPEPLTGLTGLIGLASIGALCCRRRRV